MTTALTDNPHVLSFVSEKAKLCQPDRIHWCDGSEAEKDALTAQAVAEGILIPLDQDKLPGCYLHRSSPLDVARVEGRTFICTPTREEAGPTNNWMAPDEAYAKMKGLYEGSMKGGTMYVVPYVMGPIGSPFSKIGVELTDSIYVVLSMRVMARMGQAALNMLGQSDDFNRGLHAKLDIDPEKRYICHFPEDNAIMSCSSNYGGNVLLGKKCLALRIGSYLGRKEGWLAEHMLILGVESPEGQTTYVTAAFPSACGKTNFAMLIPPERFDGWKVWTVGDDIAWLHVGDDGRLWAINPEAGYFGVAPGTSEKSNPNALASCQRDTIFTNVGLTPDGDVWWEGKTDVPPEGVIDWKGNAWDPSSGEKVAHPNARFCAPMANNPALSSKADDPKGVPISAMIFGGRRETTIPLILQSFNWTHGAFLGATMGSETTAAATGKVGIIRRDPMAMLPFCGYDMGTYFNHWLAMQDKIKSPPKIFMVNWFRKSAEGRFLWPGFGENMRVLKWVIDRAMGKVGGRETPVGWVPRSGDLDLSFLDITRADFDAATEINADEWRTELDNLQEWFDKLGDTLPAAFHAQRQLLIAVLDSMGGGAKAAS